jgi:hypothetical protein
MGMPVFTPGPTTRIGAWAHFSATDSHSRISTGTVEERQIASTDSKSSSPPSSTPSSSAVDDRSVASRQWSRSAASE